MNNCLFTVTNKLHGTLVKVYGVRNSHSIVSTRDGNWYIYPSDRVEFLVWRDITDKNNGGYEEFVWMDSKVYSAISPVYKSKNKSKKKGYKNAKP